jgi:hypothetical protein
MAVNSSLRAFGGGKHAGRNQRRVCGDNIWREDEKCKAEWQGEVN